MQAVQQLLKSSGGAIPIAHFMRLALTSPLYGYYTRSNSAHSIFGRHGDFITSPEICTVFGEMLGLWLIKQASQLKREFSLIELGPGRGTLIADILKTWINLPHLTRNFAGLYLVEPSLPLREAQRQAISKALGEPLRPVAVGGKATGENYTLFGMPVGWYSHFEQIPEDLGASPVILAHEFFDALPIHQFRLTEQGWREVLVTADKDKPCDLHLALSKAETSNLILPPSNDDRYRIGDYFEINPEAIYLIKRFSERIARQKSGVALVVDYGYDGIKKTATFRGIKNHQFVNPLQNIGETDLTADLDFQALTNAVKSIAHDGIETYPTLTQREFLDSMGIRLRVSQLEKSIAHSEHEKRSLKASCDRLTATDSTGMGEVYKFWAIRAGVSGSPFPFGCR